MVKFFRIIRCFKKKGQPELVRRTMAFSPSPGGLHIRSVVISALRMICKATVKAGEAPPGHLEREIQEGLELIQ